MTGEAVSNSDLPERHAVRFYGHESELLAPLSSYLRAGLDAEDGVVLIASREHLVQLRERLSDSHWQEALEKRSLIALDDADAVDEFTSGGALAQERFEGRVTAIIDAVREASASRRVRIFGEAVGIFTARGDFDSARELEGYWNDLQDTSDFTLLCAYPYAHFPSALHHDFMVSLCECHSDVHAASRVAKPSDRHAAIQLALLEQKARVATLELAERRRLRNELTRRKGELTQARKAEMMALQSLGLIHDFNNFLTVIDCATEHLLQARLPEAEQKDILHEIKDAAEHAQRLATRLLARGESDAPRPELLDPNRLLEHSSRLYRRVVHGRAEFVTAFQAGLGSVRADATHIEQIVLNLVVNARDAVGDHGRIVLSTRRLTLPSKDDTFPKLPWGDYVIIEVSDNGKGIPEAARDHIFEPFFSTKGHGSGLGLSSVQHLARQNQGRVALRTNPEGGVTFSVAFPERSSAN